MSEPCVDVTELYPPRRAPVCDRGRVGCPITHLAIPAEREVPVEHRPSDDFEGAVE